MSGTPTPGSPTTRETRYAARSLRESEDQNPSVDAPLGDLTITPTADQPAQNEGTEEAKVKTEEPSAETFTQSSVPETTTSGGTLTAHQAAMAARQSLLRQLAESDALLSSLAPTIHAPMSTTAQPAAPMKPTVQPAAPMPATVQANFPSQPVQGTLARTPTAPPGSTMTIPAPAPTMPSEPLPPSTITFEAIDWEFISVPLHTIQHTRGPAFAEVSSAAHRMWGMFPPGSDPTVSIALFRATAGGVSTEFVQAANTLLLSLRRFHANAGRGHTWSTPANLPNASAQTPPATTPTPALHTSGPVPSPTPVTTILPAPTTAPITGTPTPATGPAISTEPMTEAERRSVRRAYATIDLRKIDPLPRFPFPANVDVAVSLGQLFASSKLALGDILVMSDDSEKQAFDRPPWVVGWDGPLQKIYRKSLSSPQVASSPLPRLIDEFFDQVRRELTINTAGPSAYRKLLSLLTAHFDDGDQGRAFEQLHTFGVPDNTEFGRFLRAFKQRVSIVQGTERVFKPSDAMVIEVARGVVSRQYPSLMPTLYPGRLMTTPDPFRTVEEMWAAFEVLATNKTPAVNGSRFHAVSSGGHTTYTSSPTSSTHQAHPRGHGTHRHGSQHNPIIMNVADNTADPFSTDESDWPLRNFEEVYMVTTTFSTPDPPLLTPLLTSSARAQALRDYGGRCLNCSGTDHSMKTCDRPFINTSGIINPALGQLNDGGHAFRQWQQRMRSYRRGQYERNVDRNSNRHNRNNNNHRSNNNSRHHRGNNGRSHNGRHNHGRSYGGGNNHHYGQQPQIEAAAAASGPAPTPSTALTVHTPGSTATTPAPPANMRIGQGFTNNPNHRQPGTFRTN